MKISVDNFLDEVSKLKPTNIDGTIRVIQNGKPFDPVVAVANVYGGSFRRDEIALARQFIGMPFGVYDSIQRACEDAPGCNKNYRSRMMGLGTRKVDAESLDMLGDLLG